MKETSAKAAQLQIDHAEVVTEKMVLAESLETAEKQVATLEEEVSSADSALRTSQKALADAAPTSPDALEIMSKQLTERNSHLESVSASLQARLDKEILENSRLKEELSDERIRLAATKENLSNAKAAVKGAIKLQTGYVERWGEELQNRRSEEANSRVLAATLVDTGRQLADSDLREERAAADSDLKESIGKMNAEVRKEMKGGSISEFRIT